MQADYNNSITFNARLGKNLKSFLAQNEFGGNLERVNKFEKLFYDTFEKAIDTNTVLEINNRAKFYIYNPGLKGGKVPVKIYEKKGNSLAQNILKECSIAYSRAEYVLFQKYISSHIAKGQSLEKIKLRGESKLDNVRRPYFTDLIETASRLLKENPKSKLTESDFSDMINVQMREIIDTPEFQKLMSSYGVEV